MTKDELMAAAATLPGTGRFAIPGGEIRKARKDGIVARETWVSFWPADPYEPVLGWFQVPVH